MAASYCTHCRLEQPRGAARCMRCNRPVAGGAPPPPRSGGSEPGGGSKECPRCHFKNGATAGQCLTCGTDLSRVAASAAPPPRARPKVRPGPPRAERPTRAMRPTTAYPPPAEDTPTERFGAERPTQAFRPPGGAPLSAEERREGGTTRWMHRDQLEAAQPGSDRTTQRFKAQKAAPPGLPAYNVPEEAGGQAVAWLHCPPLRPVPVGAKPQLVVGRSRSCDLILPHDSVSRAHAVVRALGEELTLEDRSTYGTTLNGERIRQAKLKPGDTIGIGPYEIQVKDQVERPQEESTRPLRVARSSEAMQGRLEKVSLFEVLQQIEFNKKTGTLTVFGGEEKGLLVVYEGLPMYAEMAGNRDAEAVFHMLDLERGDFSFMAKVEPGEKTMEGPLTGVLMEYSRRVDESGSGAA